MQDPDDEWGPADSTDPTALSAVVHPAPAQRPVCRTAVALGVAAASGGSRQLANNCSFSMDELLHDVAGSKAGSVAGGSGTQGSATADEGPSYFEQHFEDKMRTLESYTTGELYAGPADYYVCVPWDARLSHVPSAARDFD